MADPLGRVEIEIVANTDAFEKSIARVKTAVAAMGGTGAGGGVAALNSSLAATATNMQNVGQHSATLNRSLASTAQSANAVAQSMHNVHQTAGPLGVVVHGLTEQLIDLGRGYLALLSVEKAVDFLKESAAAFGEQQQQVRLLETQLARLGDRTSLNMETLDKYRETLVATTTATNEQARAAELSAIRLGVTDKSMKQVLDTAQNLAAVGFGDLVSNVELLSRAIENPERLLSRLALRFPELGGSFKSVVLGLRQTGDAAAATKLITDQLNQSIGGAGRVAAEGYAGAISQLSKAWGEFQEHVGEFLVNNTPLLRILQGAVDELDGFKKGLDGVTKSVIDLEKELGFGTGEGEGLVDQLIQADNWWKSLNARFAQFLSLKNMFKGFGTGVIGSFSPGGAGDLTSIPPPAAAPGPFGNVTNTASKVDALLTPIQRLNAAFEIVSLSADNLQKHLDAALEGVTDPAKRDAIVRTTLAIFNWGTSASFTAAKLEELAQAERQRIELMQHGVQAAQLEITLAGKSLEQAEATRQIFQDIFALKQKIAQERGVSISEVTLTPDQVAGITQADQAIAHANQSLRETQAALQSAYETQTLFWSDTEQKVAATLRSVYGEAWPQYLNSIDAQQTRLNSRLLETYDITRSFAGTFVDGIMSGKSAVDSLTAALGDLQKKLIDMALDNVIKGLFGMLAGGGTPGSNLFTSLFSGGAGTSSTSTTANPATFQGGGFVGSTPRPRRRGGKLAYDEFPAILHVGEQVIPASGPRPRMSGQQMLRMFGGVPSFYSGLGSETTPSGNYTYTNATGSRPGPGGTSITTGTYTSNITGQSFTYDSGPALRSGGGYGVSGGGGGGRVTRISSPRVSAPVIGGGGVTGISVTIPRVNPREDEWSSLISSIPEETPFSSDQLLPSVVLGPRSTPVKTTTIIGSAYENAPSIFHPGSVYTSSGSAASVIPSGGFPMPHNLFETPARATPSGPSLTGSRYDTATPITNLPPDVFHPGPWMTPPTAFPAAFPNAGAGTFAGGYGSVPGFVAGGGPYFGLGGGGWRAHQPPTQPVLPQGSLVPYDTATRVATDATLRGMPGVALGHRPPTGPRPSPSDAALAALAAGGNTPLIDVPSYLPPTVTGRSDFSIPPTIHIGSPFGIPVSGPTGGLVPWSTIPTVDTGGLGAAGRLAGAGAAAAIQGAQAASDAIRGAPASVWGYISTLPGRIATGAQSDYAKLQAQLNPPPTIGFHGEGAIGVGLNAPAGGVRAGFRPIDPSLLRGSQYDPRLPGDPFTDPRITGGALNMMSTNPALQPYSGRAPLTPEQLAAQNYGYGNEPYLSDITFLRAMGGAAHFNQAFYDRMRAGTGLSKNIEDLSGAGPVVGYDVMRAHPEDAARGVTGSDLDVGSLAMGALRGYGNLVGQPIARGIDYLTAAVMGPGRGTYIGNYSEAETMARIGAITAGFHGAPLDRPLRDRASLPLSQNVQDERTPGVSSTILPGNFTEVPRGWMEHHATYRPGTGDVYVGSSGHTYWPNDPMLAIELGMRPGSAAAMMQRGDDLMAGLNSPFVRAASHQIGGVVGSTPVSHRLLPSKIFRRAPRFQDGLAADEYPAVLHAGETVTPASGRPRSSGQAIVINTPSQPAPNVIVNVTNNASAQVSTSSQDDNGNIRLDIMIDEMVSSKMRDGGSRISRTMAGMGARALPLRR